MQERQYIGRKCEPELDVARALCQEGCKKAESLRHGCRWKHTNGLVLVFDFRKKNSPDLCVFTSLLVRCRYPFSYLAGKKNVVLLFPPAFVRSLLLSAREAQLALPCERKSKTLQYIFGRTNLKPAPKESVHPCQGHAEARGHFYGGHAIIRNRNGEIHLAHNN
jgi:hypothetical protein